MDAIVGGSWDERGRDLDQRFARFGTEALTDDEVCALSMASMVMPANNPGAWGYLTKVAQVDCYATKLVAWGRTVAAGIAAGKYRAKHGQRRRSYVEGYDERWGRYAVADALLLATRCPYDPNPVPSAEARCTQLGVGRQAYERIRDFVGIALVEAIAEYRHALEWALGWKRDWVFVGRWEGITGLKWAPHDSDAKLGYPQGHKFPRFAPGCDRTIPLKDQGDAYAEQPETLYPALRPSNFWSDGYARHMRLTCPVTVKPRHGTNSLAADGRAAHAVDAAKSSRGTYK